MDHDDSYDTSRKPPQDWLDAIARSEADLAAGRVVPGEAVLRRVRESINRTEVRQAAPEREVAPRR